MSKGFNIYIIKETKFDPIICTDLALLISVLKSGGGYFAREVQITGWYDFTLYVFTLYQLIVFSPSSISSPVMPFFMKGMKMTRLPYMQSIVILFERISQPLCIFGMVIRFICSGIASMLFLASLWISIVRQTLGIGAFPLGTLVLRKSAECSHL